MEPHPPPPCCPIIGHNSIGFASSKNGPKKLVCVEYVASAGLLYSRDLSNQKRIVVHMSDFTPVPCIPSRYREYNWNQVEEFWKQALDAYPAAVLITPAKLSHETLARKLREARYARDRYLYAFKLCDPTRWNEIAHRLLVTPVEHDNVGKVQIGPQEAKEIKYYEAVVSSTNNIFIKWDGRLPALEDFCSLVGSKVFEPKPTFIVLGLTDEIITSLESRYEVGFTPRPDGKSWEVVF